MHQEIQICNKYITGTSLVNLGLEYFGNKNQYYKIKQILSKNNISIRTASQRNSTYDINCNYFNNIDTEEKAYMLGFLYADGSNVKNTITLSLKANDIDILYKFQTLLKSNRPIKIYKNNHLSSYARLTIQNDHLIKCLSNYGVTERKTFTITYPTFLPIHLDKAFIRGYFDGDGGFKLTKKLNRYNICITSNQEFCNELQNKIYHHTGIMMHIYAAPAITDNRIKRLEIGGNKQVLTISNWLYNGATIYLDRKYQKYKNLQNNPLSFKHPK